MKLGLFAATHGIGATVDGQWDLQPAPLHPVEDAQVAERAGFDSMWFSDHVAVPLSFTSRHDTADPRDGRSCYPQRPAMLDGVTTMAAVAAATSTIRVASSVLIAPYRHPLSDARQLMTVDHLSGGRLIVGVGAGWLREEFEALGRSYDDRVGVTEECLQIYRRAWTEPVVEFRGRHFDVPPVSVDPKPVTPPPIVFGGASKLTVRLAVRTCDGYFPTFVDADATPERYGALHDEARRAAEAIDRDPSTFAMVAVVSARLDDGDGPSRRCCTGRPDQVLADLERFAAAGYASVVLHLDCPSGTRSELHEQIERFGAEVLATADDLRPAGGWATELLSYKE
jgi:probable F420-dependent oxidoreductase